MRTSIFRGLLAVVLLTGCGGTEMEADETTELTSRKDELPPCGNRDFFIDYYSDPGLTIHVGAQWCTCADTTAAHYGSITRYYEYAYNFSC